MSTNEAANLRAFAKWVRDVDPTTTSWTRAKQWAEGALASERSAGAETDVDEEDVIDNAVPAANFHAPRTEVIRSIMRAIHEQGVHIERSAGAGPLVCPDCGLTAQRIGEIHITAQQVQQAYAAAQNEAAERSAGTTDATCQCGHTRPEHESRYDAPNHCTHRCVPPWHRA